MSCKFRKISRTKMKDLNINFVFWNSLWFSVFIYSRSAVTYVQKKILFQIGKKLTWQRKYKRSTQPWNNWREVKKTLKTKQILDKYLYKNSRSLSRRHWSRRDVDLKSFDWFLTCNWKYFFSFIISDKLKVKAETRVITLSGQWQSKNLNIFALCEHESIRKWIL